MILFGFVESAYVGISLDRLLHTLDPNGGGKKVSSYSYRDRDNYIDPEHSGVAQAIRERGKIPIAIFPSRAKSLPPSCPVCHRHYISQENGTILFCPGCGARIKATEIRQETKVTAMYGPLSAESANKILVSQKQEQRRGPLRKKLDEQESLEGEMTHEELIGELGFEPTHTIT